MGVNRPGAPPPFPLLHPRGTGISTPREGEKAGADRTTSQEMTRWPTPSMLCMPRDPLTGDPHLHFSLDIQPNLEPWRRCRNRRRPTQCRWRQRTESGIPVFEKVSSRESVAVASLRAKTPSSVGSFSGEPLYPACYRVWACSTHPQRSRARIPVVARGCLGVAWLPRRRQPAKPASF